MMTTRNRAQPRRQQHADIATVSQLLGRVHPAMAAKPLLSQARWEAR
jgi:hypothetical protein